jgi:hypothetical protein
MLSGAVPRLEGDGRSECGYRVEAWFGKVRAASNHHVLSDESSENLVSSALIVKRG